MALLSRKQNTIVKKIKYCGNLASISCRLHKKALKPERGRLSRQTSFGQFRFLWQKSIEIITDTYLHRPGSPERSHILVHFRWQHYLVINRSGIHSESRILAPGGNR